MRHEYTVLGGTFDHLHRGHRNLLRAAFGVADRVVIGLTADEMVSHKKHADRILPYSERRRELKEFLDSEFGRERYNIIRIRSREGSTLSDSRLEAIVASPETRIVCDDLNRQRQERGLAPMRICGVEHERGEDYRIISSTRIRAGEIDREGRVLVDYVKNDFVDRELKHIMFGLAFINNSHLANLESACNYLEQKRPGKIVCVGDIVSRDFLYTGLRINNVIVDGKTKRSENLNLLGFFRSSYSNVFGFDNPRGRISKDSWGFFKERLAVDSCIIVWGEEDLLGFPAVMALDHGDALVFGIPDKGLNVTIIDESVRLQLARFLERFDTIF